MSDERPDAAPLPPERLWRLPTWLLAHIGTDAHRIITAALDSPAQRTDYAVLTGLIQYGPISQAELGRRLGIYRSDLVGVLRSLEKSGLIERGPDPRDPRRNSVTVTTAGRRTLRRLEAKVQKAQESVLAPLSQDERERLIDLLQKLVQHHRGYRHEADADQDVATGPDA